MFAFKNILQFLFPGKNKDVADKMKNLELGEDRGAEQRFDYDLSLIHI